MYKSTTYIATIFFGLACVAVRGQTIIVSASPASIPSGSTITISTSLKVGNPPEPPAYSISGQCEAQNSKASGGNFSWTFTTQSNGVYEYQSSVKTVGKYTITCTAPPQLYGTPFYGSFSGSGSFTVTGNSCSATDSTTADTSQSPVKIAWNFSLSLDPAPDEPKAATLYTGAGVRASGSSMYVDCDGDQLTLDQDYPPTEEFNGYTPINANSVEGTWTVTSYEYQPGDPCTNDDNCDASGDNQQGYESLDASASSTEEAYQDTCSDEE